MTEWREQFGGFVEKVREDLVAIVIRERARFLSVDALVQRFEAAAETLLTRGPESLSSFEEIHNEVCTAALILEAATPPCIALEYEPTMEKCSQRFDFSASFTGQPTAWVEVKTVHPERIDKFDQYERLAREGRFPDNSHLYLDRYWLGGELFHKYFAARAGLLSYTIETEEKISCCLADLRPWRVFLVFFSNGFDWRVYQLEDFVYFYRNGGHFEGDYFRLMEEHYIKANNLELKRNIQHFGYMQRPTGAIRPTVGSWSVEPVRFSPIRGFA
jgi:hypothetical protein